MFKQDDYVECVDEEYGKELIQSAEFLPKKGTRYYIYQEYKVGPDEQYVMLAGFTYKLTTTLIIFKASRFKLVERI